MGANCCTPQWKKQDGYIAAFWLREPFPCAGSRKFTLGRGAEVSGKDWEDAISEILSVEKEALAIVENNVQTRGCGAACYDDVETALNNEWCGKVNEKISLKGFTVEAYQFIEMTQYGGVPKLVLRVKENEKVKD